VLCWAQHTRRASVERHAISRRVFHLGRSVKYSKPPLTIEEQVELLLQRGMTGSPDIMGERLTAVSYYRLSGYWYTFRNPDDTFRPGTSFDLVWSTYLFDRHLRLLIMDAIERIEIAVRSLVAYHHAHEHGAFAYAVDRASLPKMDSSTHRLFLDRVAEETARSREGFVDHFKRKYGDSHDYLPVWMAAEVMSLGTVLTFFRHSGNQVKKAVADAFGVPHRVFESWLLSLNTIRNIVAHHARLWNRELGVKPIIPRSSEYPEWHTPVKIENKRVFAVLTICRHCLLQIAPQSEWMARLEALLYRFPTVPRRHMGIPADWKDCPIWKPQREEGNPSRGTK
jgi:abortive infection bacteriophage resistance protein